MASKGEMWVFTFLFSISISDVCTGSGVCLIIQGFHGRDVKPSGAIFPKYIVA